MADKTYVLANGIELRLKPVATGATRRLIESIKREDFDSDVEFHSTRMTRVIKAYVVLGTEFLSAPPGSFGPDDDGWIEELAVAGIEISPSGPARYRIWLEMHALSSPTDYSDLFQQISMLSGGIEQEIWDSSVVLAETQAEVFNEIGQRLAGDLDQWDGNVVTEQRRKRGPRRRG